jgi:hypothetical protein
MRELTKCGNCIVWITKSRPENLRGVQPNIECRYINHKAQKKKKKKKKGNVFATIVSPENSKFPSSG